MYIPVQVSESVLLWDFVDDDNVDQSFHTGSVVATRDHRKDFEQNNHWIWGSGCAWRELIKIKKKNPTTYILYSLRKV